MKERRKEGIKPMLFHSPVAHKNSPERAVVLGHATDWMGRTERDGHAVIPHIPSQRRRETLSVVSAPPHHTHTWLLHPQQPLIGP